MTTFTYRREIKIAWAHCDPAGIVFNPRFFEFFDTNTWGLFEAALGVTQQDLAATYGIVGIALVDARGNFMKPVAFGDTIEIVSRVSEFRRVSFDVEHRLVNKGEVAVEGRESRVWAVRHADDPDRIATAPIPAEVIKKFG
ncbi:MAG TPA: thioesterase family protein [Pseudolabrys sp.]